VAAPQKETIYVDIDDEITSLIDKVRSSKQGIVALVLPKRAAVLQSVVNMKLLKRTADEEKKRIVLITSETSLLPLAGAVGLYVAKTLQSKPAIPAAPKLADSETVLDTSIPEDTNAEIDPQKPVGELAGIPNDDEETIEVDDIDEETAAPEKPAGKKAFNKKLKVPNFERFRLLIILGGIGLLLLIGAWIFAATVLPKANIIIKTDTSSFNSDITFTTGTTVKEFKKDELLLPATSKELKKTDSEKLQTTGQKDLGEKAKGKVTLALKDCSLSEVTIPAGTGVSTNNLTFITQKDVSLSSVKVGNTCQNNSFPDYSTETVDVTAQNAGDQYNISSGRNFTVAGFSAVSGTNADAMTGGTSKIVKVVAQADVDNAKQKLTERANATASEELKKLLEADSLLGITESLNIGTPTITSSPKVGEEATEVTVTSATTYTMLGVKEDELKQFVEDDVNKRIDRSKQDILDNGLDKAIFKVVEKKPNGELRVNMQTVAVAGPELDAEAIKKEIAGKKKGETQSIIQSRPGIRDVEIKYSPFWVYSTPKKISKITIDFQGNDAKNR
jgi:hypothetical protein